MALLDVTAFYVKFALGRSTEWSDGPHKFQSKNSSHKGRGVVEIELLRAYKPVDVCKCYQSALKFKLRFVPWYLAQAKPQWLMHVTSMLCTCNCRYPTDPVHRYGYYHLNIFFKPSHGQFWLSYSPPVPPNIFLLRLSNIFSQDKLVSFPGLHIS